MQNVLRHRHKRKKGLASGSNSWLGKALDVIVYPIGIAGILFSFPQVYEVWVNQNVAGVSAISWAAWSLFSLVWAAYGFVHKVRPIFYMNCVWFVINGSVALGAFLFG